MMDEFISSSSSSINSVSETYDTYSGVESMSIEKYDLNGNAFSGFGAAATCLIISIAIAGIIKIFYHASY